MNEDDHERDHDSLRTRHVQFELLRRRGTASSEYIGLPWPVLCYNRGMLMMARAPFPLEGSQQETAVGHDLTRFAQ
eukprot:8961963-Pyramimonas_sp.AAC.1